MYLYGTAYAAAEEREREREGTYPNTSHNNLCPSAQSPYPILDIGFMIISFPWPPCVSCTGCVNVTVNVYCMDVAPNTDPLSPSPAKY
jgi:hypothetical protein